MPPAAGRVPDQTMSLSAKTLLDVLGDAVVAADEDGRIVYANPVAHDLLKVPQGGLAGSVLLDIVPPRLRATHVAGVRRYLETRKPRLVGGRARVPALRSDGSEVEVELSLRAFLGEDGRLLFVAVMRDLSELAALARRNELILSSTGDGLFGLDEEGRVTFVNPAAARMLGYREDEMVGRMQHELVHHHRSDGSPYPRQECPILGVLRGGEPVEVHDDVFWRADGTSLPVEYTASPKVDHGEAVGAVVAFRDASVRRTAERYRLRSVELAAAEAASRRVIAELQQAIMVPAPPVEGLEFGLRYEPAGQDEPSGGDLFDAVVLPGGELHLAVVDVVGHGVGATKQALSVVHTLRTLTLEGWPLDRLLAQANHVLSRHDQDLLATATVARVDRAHRRVTISSAGHPPTLLVRASGATEWLGAPGIALGYPGASGGSTTNTELEPGDAVVLYTDGLVEAGKDIVDGMHRVAALAASLTTGGASAQSTADRLVDEVLADATHCDDTLALVLRVCS